VNLGRRLSESACEREREIVKILAIDDDDDDNNNNADNRLCCSGDSAAADMRAATADDTGIESVNEEMKMRRR